MVPVAPFLPTQAPQKLFPLHDGIAAAEAMTALLPESSEGIPNANDNTDMEVTANNRVDGCFMPLLGLEEGVVDLPQHLFFDVPEAMLSGCSARAHNERCDD